MRDEFHLYIATFVTADGAFHVIVLHLCHENEAMDSIKCIRDWKRPSKLTVAPVSSEQLYRFADLRIGHLLELA